MNRDYKRTNWYLYLDHGMRDLVDQSLQLIAEELAFKKKRFHDYSFLVFPVAKAYEGFLKKVLYDLELITLDQLEGKHFRIGRSLNPDLPDKYRDDDWKFDELQSAFVACGWGHLAEQMWKAWAEGRNRLFHYFAPDHANFVDVYEAENRVRKIIEVMEQVMECELVQV